ncbi:hypothetical protein AX767_01400 [Variovorax sp. PAMC 28711]|nr:hypothetical protein AX767_01400 [Variovorax sp. PAMC 28711]
MLLCLVDLLCQPLRTQPLELLPSRIGEAHTARLGLVLGCVWLPALASVSRLTGHDIFRMVAMLAMK